MHTATSKQGYPYGKTEQPIQTRQKVIFCDIRKDICFPF